MRYLSFVALSWLSSFVFSQLIDLAFVDTLDTPVIKVIADQTSQIVDYNQTESSRRLLQMFAKIL
jgi:hypothetical protein